MAKLIAVLRLLCMLLALAVATPSLAAAPDTEALRAKHTEALRAKYPDYAAALAALGEEQTSQAIAALTKLAAADDADLAVDASFFLGRALAIEERFEEALSALEKVTPQSGNAHTGEALYLKGTCQARTLKRKDAVATWESFLKDHPNAPERMRVDAARQVAEFKKIDDGSIGDIQHRMGYAGRRLSLSDAGQPTRDRQEEIVAMLTKLIEENEKEQDQSDQQGQPGDQPGQPGGSPGQGGQQSQGGQQGSGPGGASPGGNRQASGNEVAGRAHQASSRGQFGDSQQRERMDRVYSAMKDRFPAQFGKLVEQYSKSLQDEKK